MVRDEHHPYTSGELEEMPTLEMGQADDLKVEETDRWGDKRRWWLARCGPEDGETHHVHLERRVSGRWTVVGEYEPY